MIKELLWQRLCAEVLIGKELLKLKKKRAWQKSYDGTISWRDFLWHEFNLTEKHAQEMTHIAKWFIKKRLTPEDIKGYNSRRELSEDITKRDFHTRKLRNK